MVEIRSQKKFLDHSYLNLQYISKCLFILASLLAVSVWSSEYFRPAATPANSKPPARNSTLVGAANEKSLSRNSSLVNGVVGGENEKLPPTHSSLVNGVITDSLLQAYRWNILNWNEAPDNSEYTCQWVLFNSTTGKSAQMCVHPFRDIVSGYIRRAKRWNDCNILPRYWSKGIDSDNEIYIEVGANIGACVMEMLLSTDANIIAFEPHPRNQFCLHSTMSKLSSDYQKRVALVPIALGDKKGTSTIYSAKGNMGNSVVGKIIKDFKTQVFDETEQADINLERLDSILSTNINVRLMKMDAQGFECNIVDGMGAEIPQKIQQIKFEWAKEWLLQQNCTTLLPKIRNFGFEIYHMRYNKESILNTNWSNFRVTDFHAKRVNL